MTVRLQVAQPQPPDVTAVATDRYLASAGARIGQRVDLAFGGETVPVRIVRVGTRDAHHRGVERRGAAGRSAVREPGVGGAVRRRPEPTEWWLRPRRAPRRPRSPRRCGRGPTWIRRRSWCGTRLAGQLRDDPFGAGPEAAFTAAAGVAAALAAVGFAVSAAGSLRERGAEFAVLRALGAPRRRLARAVAVEQGVLVGSRCWWAPLLGAVLTRAVVPLIVLTDEAARPVPPVLVELPVAAGGRTAGGGGTAPAWSRRRWRCGGRIRCGVA